MRNTFINRLLSLAKNDSSIFLIVGDLGYGVIDDFERELPDQFLNAGVAEQNMMGVAAGLAMSGYKVFVYSIANFPTMRCLEQIRMDVCYHNLDVSIVSVGAGYSYGTLGYSHHAVEDLGVMRTMPNLTIYSPSDPFETLNVIQDSLTFKGPKYFRLGKNGEGNIERLSSISGVTPSQICEGENILMLATGSITSEAAQAVEMLAAEGIEISLFSIPLIKPLKFDQRFFDKYNHLFVVEEHSKINGLGTALSDYIHEQQLDLRLVKLALPDEIQIGIGSQDYLRRISNLDSKSIVRSVKNELGR